MNKHGGYFGEEKNKVIDFSVNINPLGVPERLISELKESLTELVRYPEIDGESAKRTLAEKLNVESESLILGNGATELIYLFARALRPEKVLIVQPTFTEYARAFELNGGSVSNFNTEQQNDFNIDIDSLINELNRIKPKALVICNPNNPTGVFTDKEVFKPVLDVLREIGACLFIDESFIDFTDKYPYASLVDRYQIFILRSMTKTYAIPGLRLGYGLASKEIVTEMNRLKEPWTLNSLALSAVPVLLEDDEYMAKMKEWHTKENEFLYNELNSINGLKVYKSDANFFLCKLFSASAQSLKQYMLNRNICIRTCEDFYGFNDEYVRFAVRSREENELLIRCLKEYFK